MTGLMEGRTMMSDPNNVTITHARVDAVGAMDAPQTRVNGLLVTSAQFVQYERDSFASTANTGVWGLGSAPGVGQAVNDGV